VRGGEVHRADAAASHQGRSQQGCAATERLGARRQGAAARHPKFRIPVAAFSHCMGFGGFHRVFWACGGKGAWARGKWRCFIHGASRAPQE